MYDFMKIACYCCVILTEDSLNASVKNANVKFHTNMPDTLNIFSCEYEERQTGATNKINHSLFLIQHAIKALLPIIQYEQCQIKEDEMSGGYDSYGR
jgi:hypothetical protein